MAPHGTDRGSRHTLPDSRAGLWIIIHRAESRTPRYSGERCPGYCISRYRLATSRCPNDLDHCRTGPPRFRQCRSDRCSRSIGRVSKVALCLTRHRRRRRSLMRGDRDLGARRKSRRPCTRSSITAPQIPGFFSRRDRGRAFRRELFHENRWNLVHRRPMNGLKRRSKGGLGRTRGGAPEEECQTAGGQSRAGGEPDDPFRRAAVAAVHA